MPAEEGQRMVVATDTRRAVPRLHLITHVGGAGDVLGTVDAALAAGAPLVQVRAPGWTDRALFDLALAVTTKCREEGALCVVNDRVDVALAVGAHGVHVGEHDLPVRVVRRLAAGDLLVGATARDAASARRLVAHGADYLGVGPVYTTVTKDGLPAPIGVDGLRAVAQAVDVPVIAIAGITAERVPEVLHTGAHGVAVVGAVARAADPGAATRTLLRLLDDGDGRPEEATS
jgi:thiamine-phosphate pyrophosphorylase